MCGKGKAYLICNNVVILRNCWNVCKLERSKTLFCCDLVHYCFVRHSCIARGGLPPVVLIHRGLGTILVEFGVLGSIWTACYHFQRYMEARKIVAKWESTEKLWSLERKFRVPM